ncbi:MAG: hypothetical protein MZW92_13745 [Comamonadaceae bacterium]|nr:hypothetical protein [Comamonadaceae bacterium]
MVLVNTNVLRDIIQDDFCWADWSQQQLEMAALRGPLAITVVIYAELSMAYERIEDFEHTVALVGLRDEPIPRRSVFPGRQGHIFNTVDAKEPEGACRRISLSARTPRSRVFQSLTRDVGRYRTYFPTVEILGAN